MVDQAASSISACMSSRPNMTRSSERLVAELSRPQEKGLAVNAPLASHDAPLVNATRFRQAHEGDWERLEQIVTRMEKRSIRVASDEDLLALPALYRTTLSSLSVARDTSLDRALITYLERLCTRAYFQIYGVQTPAWRQMTAFSRAAGPRRCARCGAKPCSASLLTFGARAARLPARPKRSELVLQHRPGGPGRGPRSLGFGGVPRARHCTARRRTGSPSSRPSCSPTTARSRSSPLRWASRSPSRRCC